MNELTKSLRVVFWGLCIILSLLLIMNVISVNKDRGIGIGNGLDYGLDFAGGTQLQLRLEKSVDSNTMAIEKSIIENRLNSIGLKDVSVRPWGTQYILIQIVNASPSEAENIEEIIKQQAKFEQRIDGELAVMGDEISVDLGPQGTEIHKEPGGYGWAVLVSHTSSGACRFGEVGNKKKGRPVDIFIDRPTNTTILMAGGTYRLLSNLTSTTEDDRIYFGDSAIRVITNRSAIPVVVLENDTNQTLSELKNYISQGYGNVILAGGEDKISNAVRNMIAELGLKTIRKPQENQSYEEWIRELTGLESSPRLNFDPRGECVYKARITGGAGTLEEARLAVKRNQVLLTSGNLPAKATIESKSTTPPTLGMKFLRYGALTGIIAILTVSLVIYLRYRRLFIAVPIMATGLSEIIIILGLASLINWELDLPAVAGIIAAVGTGVDHQIVITDETLRRIGQVKKTLSISQRIKRAFFIIFTAAATTIAAMIPIMNVGAGMLKGFAFTTIMGVLIGVFIARPAYAKIIETLLRARE